MVLAGREQSGRLQLVIVEGTLQAVLAVQNVSHLAYVAHAWILYQRGVLIVGTVVWHGPSCSQPRTTDVLRFAQVGQGNDVAGVGSGACLVGYPHLYALDGDATGYGGQGAHVLVVGVAEMVCQIEVAVLFVVRYLYLVGCGVGTSTARHALAGRLLLAEDGLQFQFAELHVGAQTEQAAHTWHKAHVGRHGNVASLHQFYYLVLLALVLQFQVLRIVVKGGIRVVVQVHVHLVAHLGIDGHVYLHVEVQTEGTSAAGGKCGVVRGLHVGAYFQFCRTLGLDVHAAGAEYLFSRAQGEAHVGEVELAVALGKEEFLIALPVVLRYALAQAPVHVLLGGHHHWRGEVTGCGKQVQTLVVDGQETAQLHVSGVLVVTRCRLAGGGLGHGLALLGILGLAVTLHEGRSHLVCPVLLVVGNLGLQVVWVLEVGGAVLYVFGSFRGGSADGISRLLFLCGIVFLLVIALPGRSFLCVGARNKKRYM